MFEMVSLYFQDLLVGRSFSSPTPRLIDESLIARFAEVSGDKNPLHLNPVFAKKSPFGRKIAHGLLGLSAASGLLHDIGIVQETIVAFAALQWKFKRPILIGDRVSLKMTVSKLRKLGPDKGIAVFKAELANQKKEVVQEGLWSLIIRSSSD